MINNTIVIRFIPIMIITTIMIASITAVTVIKNNKMNMELSFFDLASSQVTIVPGVDESSSASTSPASLSTSLEEGSTASTVNNTAGTGRGPRLVAQDIAQTNTLKVDADVKNPVILIPLYL